MTNEKKHDFAYRFSLLLTGCWDQRELSTITIVTGMAIDKGKNGNFKLTIEGINETELYDQTADG